MKHTLHPDDQARLLGIAADQGLCIAGLKRLFSAEKYLVSAGEHLDDAVPALFFDVYKQNAGQAASFADMLEAIGTFKQRVRVKTIGSFIEKLNSSDTLIQEAIASLLSARRILEELPQLKRLEVDFPLLDTLMGPAGELANKSCKFDFVGLGARDSIVLLEELKSDMDLTKRLTFLRPKLLEQHRKYLSYVLEYRDRVPVEAFRYRILADAAKRTIDAGDLGSGRGGDLMLKLLKDDGLAWIEAYRTASKAKARGSLPLKDLDAFTARFTAHVDSGKFMIKTNLARGGSP